MPKKKGNMSISPQQFDYFLVLDFEATCERGIKLKPQEIIEFPCLKVKVILRGEREECFWLVVHNVRSIDFVLDFVVI